MRLAGWIFRYWMAHDLDYVDDICSRWAPGHRLERIKFEILALLLKIISKMHGYDPDGYQFYVDAMKDEQ